MSSPWWSAYPPRPEAPIRLYCLPCAGADATMFRDWAPYVPAGIELRAVRLPARRAGHPEPAFPDCATAAARLAGALELDRPYVLFGYSMGALVAHQFLQLAEWRGLPLPVLLVVASWPAEGIALDRLPDPANDDGQFLRALARLGGVAPEVLLDPEILEYALPALRADFRLCRTYVYQPGSRPTDVPVSVLGGVADAVTSLDELDRWRHHTRQFVGLRPFPGGHFFLRDQPGGVVAQIVADINSVH